MFTVQEFFTEKPKAALIADKIRTYENGAMTFFREQFPRLADQLDDDQLRKVVKLAYENAKKRGITTERDHWKYLIIVAFWGSHFETDPQYEEALKKAGWFEDGDYAYVPALIRQVDEYPAAVATDVASYKRFMDAFLEIYIEPFPKKITPEITIKIMQYVWPARYKLMSKAQKVDLAHQGVGRGKELELSARDTVTYICLSMYFGHRFDEDPLYPWAGAALALDGRDLEMRRAALWQGVSTFFDKFIGSE